MITRLDDRTLRTPVPEHRYIARSADGDRTVLLGVPLEGRDPRAFMIEADASRYLLGPWASPATDIAPPGEAPWHARPYVPALPLPTALAVHGGPLPERTVRAIGLAVAETLLIGHGQNLTHAGVSPAAVLLAADGPRLTCFGAVRAAAPDGTARSRLPGLDPGSLPPEQAAGGRPRPLGDVYALGATLAYAATGRSPSGRHTPEPDELPPGLRPVILRCLAEDPTARPMPRELLETLERDAGVGVPAGAGVPHGDTGTGTVIDAQPSSAGRAAPLLGPGWLPARVIAALAHQASAILSAELPAPAPQQMWQRPSAPGAHPAPSPSTTPSPAPPHASAPQATPRAAEPPPAPAHPVHAQGPAPHPAPFPPPG